MRYVAARVSIEKRDEAYRVYVSDSLRILTGTKERYADWIGLTARDDRSADEVKASIMTRFAQLGD